MTHAAIDIRSTSPSTTIATSTTGDPESRRLAEDARNYLPKEALVTRCLDDVARKRLTG